MLKHPDLTKGRLSRFFRELKDRIYVEPIPVKELAVYDAPG
jgi:hypothetical protein